MKASKKKLTLKGQGEYFFSPSKLHVYLNALKQLALELLCKLHSDMGGGFGQSLWGMIELLFCQTGAHLFFPHPHMAMDIHV